jgi:hypothetical protein
MLKHIVMWKLKDFAEGVGKKENALRIKKRLEGLKEKIKEVRVIEVGINLNQSADFYDIVLYTEFDNVKDLEIYQNHPEHQNVGDFISKVRLERRVVDYEV